MPDNLPKPLEYRIGELLRVRGLLVVTAESCTGGLIADRLTDVPGSSEYFAGGVVAYANAVKTSTLGVSPMTITQHGAVSRETVLEMAHGARSLLHAHLAVSVSGIAGPGGGLPDKPVGTTWIGLAAGDGAWARLFYWEGDRRQNKLSSAEAVLQMLLDYLNGDRLLDGDPH